MIINAKLTKLFTKSKSQVSKTFLITGATDGLGLGTAIKVAKNGHNLLLHGRNEQKLEAARKTVLEINPEVTVSLYYADLSDLTQVKKMTKEILNDYEYLDGILNNAGLYNTKQRITIDDLEVRFAVNTIAPYLITTELLTILDSSSHVINVSSAAQESVDLQYLTNEKNSADEEDYELYAQSKLAILMWTNYLAKTLEDAPILISVNPASMLSTKLVRESFGVKGNDMSIGVNIFVDLLTNERYYADRGRYFDNDRGSFAPSHQDGNDYEKCQKIVTSIEAILKNKLERTE